MTIDIKEKQFENHIEKVLLDSGYIKRNSTNFDKKYAIDFEIFIEFIKDAQLESWKKLQESYDSGVENEILRHLINEIDTQGLIHVIRNGFSIYDIHLDCAYFRPVSSKNPDSLKQYQKNILSIIRQARFSEKSSHSVDLLLCLNGIPVATGEIKNPATGQSFEDAIRQYKEDRDPKERLFSFKQGALVHFAIDPFEIHMTTKLQQDKTVFLPFNKGRNEGRGNPDTDGYRTSYLWEQIWQKETWLEIIYNFIDLQIIEQKAPALPKEFLIFPRYHQLDAVLRLTNATKHNGPGTNYLIQHSTGSGKSNTIAWLAYKLFSLHDDNDRAIFDGIVVLSDRIGIVNQLGNTIKQFEQTPGTVIAVEDSSELAAALQTQRKIVITTQQKFPPALEKISKVKGKFYAVIIDEAHSSQTGEGATTVKETLTTNLEEEAKKESQKEEAQKDLIDRIQDEMRHRGPQETLSYYAFTATPKKKTLGLFGVKVSETDYEPFHVYSMKQAIQEGFILDVLKNYTTYEKYFKIIQTSEDKVVEGKKASRVLMKYVETHHLTVSQKSHLILEHFRTHTMQKIGGLAKAMVVTSSRAQALQYKQEIDEYIKNQGYSGIKTLVAFSGTLQDSSGTTFTEQSINKTKTEWELREKFDSPEYNMLIVAEKYQTGYDQPLLHTMYIDKKLHTIKTVQTLSRLNRTYPGKTDTLVVDFQNTVEEITSAFEPYYKGTTLVNKTDPVHLFNLYQQIMDYRIINESDLDRFAQTFFKPRHLQNDTDLGKLYAAVGPILTRFTDAQLVDQVNFKLKLVHYLEAYSFLAQIAVYDDINLEKLFAITKFLANENLIPEIGAQIPELRGDISLQWYRLEKTHEGSIALAENTPPITLVEDKGRPKTPDVPVSLSEVIRTINEAFEGQFTDADTIAVEEWRKLLENDLELREIAKVNVFEDFLKHFETKFRDVIISSYDMHTALVSRIFSNPQLQKELVIAAATFYHKWVKSNNLPPITPTNPAQNRLIFKQTIHRCKGFVNWLDLYLNKEALDFMIDNFDRVNVKEIKLLTSLYDNEYSINERLLEQFKAYQDELKQGGIDLSMKVITTKEGHNRVAHDRYLLGQNIKFNVPSFTLMVRGRFSEIKQTQNEIPFEQYWTDLDSLDLVKDWDKIKRLVTFDVTCSDCGKQTQVNFRPDGKRPVYCKECYMKHKKQ